ncbi:glycosyltransferase 87 family protein [Terrabacter sp. 2RAF25]|uniref:glycosyltransferase 87 family protein n=1 Tax=Terrabacter sp. 2RAF25 TaxID=3232998 RepID=UPI003F9B691F
MATKHVSGLTHVMRGTALVLVMEMLWRNWAGNLHGSWVDSDVYALGGDIVRHGGDLYSATTSEFLPFTYSPFAAVMFVPFSMLQAEVGRVLFTLVSLTCYTLVVATVSRRLRLAWWQVALLAGVGLAFEPMLRNVQLGQVNIVLMALVVTDWLLLPKRYRGYLTGIAAGIKITPAAFFVLAVIRRDWAVAARGGVGLLGSVVLGWLVAPAASRTFWGGGFMGLEKFGRSEVLATDNQSLLGAWMRLTGTIFPSQTMQFATLLIGMSLGVTAAYIELRRARPGTDVAAVCWVALGSLLGSPVSWSHHWIWLVVALGVLLSRARYVGFALTALVSWYPTIWISPPGDYRELMLNAPQRILSCAYVIVGITLLISSLREPRPRRRAPSGREAARDLIEARAPASIAR